MTKKLIYDIRKTREKQVNAVNEFCKVHSFCANLYLAYF